MIRFLNIEILRRISILTFFLLTLIFGRSFMGIYIYSLRIGEYLIAISFVIYIYILIFKKNYINEIHPYLYATLMSLPFTLLIFSFIKSDSLLNPYFYRSSMYIWTISFILVGYLFSIYIKIDISLIFLINLFLILSYYTSVIYYPNFVSVFFENYGDKFDFLKASEIILIFVFTVFFNNLYFDTKVKYYLFFIYFSLFLPLFTVMSRGAALGLLVFFIFEIFRIRKIIKENLIIFTFVLVLGIGIAITSSYLIVEEETVEEKGISYVIQDVLETKNTKSENLFSFYSHSNRLFSTDGNINFRLQIWQDVVSYSYSGKVLFPREGLVKLSSFKGYEFLIGSKYTEKIPAMNNQDYQGLDRTNESVHNYFINIFARGGLIHLVLILYFYFIILRTFKSSYIDISLVNIMTPLLIVAMFDASMDSPNFPLLYFFLIGVFLSNIKQNNY